MKNNNGLTLVEVMVSIVIVFIFFMGTTAGGLLVLDQNVRNDQRDEAVNIAEEVMAGMRNTPFEDIMTLNNVQDNVLRNIRGRERQYTLNRTVRYLGPGEELAELGVVVSWTRMDSGNVDSGALKSGGHRPVVYTHTLNTIVRK